MVEGTTPTRATTELRSLHPKIRSVWRFGSVMTGLLMALVGAGLFSLIGKIADKSVPPLAVTGAIVGFVLFGVVGMTLVDKQFDNWRYQLRDYDVLIKKGLVWRSERYIARDRVQHIDINAGPMDRRFGLVQVVIYSAGVSGSVGLIPGLTPDEAEWLRDQLLTERALDA